MQHAPIAKLLFCSYWRSAVRWHSPPVLPLFVPPLAQTRDHKTTIGVQIKVWSAARRKKSAVAGPLRAAANESTKREYGCRGCGDCIYNCIIGHCLISARSSRLGPRSEPAGQIALDPAASLGQWAANAADWPRTCSRITSERPALKVRSQGLGSNRFTGLGIELATATLLLRYCCHAK